jgi:hypothetical protein
VRLPKNRISSPGPDRAPRPYRGHFIWFAMSDQAAVTIEVDLADSSLGPDGSYQSVIQVRISSPDKQACEMVKEAIQLAIQEAVEDASAAKVERRH